MIKLIKDKAYLMNTYNVQLYLCRSCNIVIIVFCNIPNDRYAHAISENTNLNKLNIVDIFAKIYLQMWEQQCLFMIFIYLT